jgi:hypothetical protein
MTKKTVIQQMDEQDLIIHYRTIFKMLNEFAKLEDELIDPIREPMQALSKELEAELLNRGYTEEDTADLSKVSNAS